MARRLLAGVFVAAALGIAGPAGASQLPILRSATVVHRHLVLRLSVTDLRPTELLVARRRAVDIYGALLQRNVRLRESIHLPVAATGVVRWRSRATLRPGAYFVQVKAVESGGLTDCPRALPNCNERWSNVRRVVVPK